MHHQGIRIVGVEGQRTPETDECPLGSHGRELREVVAGFEKRLIGRDVCRLASRRLGGAEA